MENEIRLTNKEIERLIQAIGIMECEFTLDQEDIELIRKLKDCLCGC